MLPKQFQPPASCHQSISMPCWCLCTSNTYRNTKELKESNIPDCSSTRSLLLFCLQNNVKQMSSNTRVERFFCMNTLQAKKERGQNQCFLCLSLCVSLHTYSDIRLVRGSKMPSGRSTKALLSINLQSITSN